MERVVRDWENFARGERGQGRSAVSGQTFLKI